MAKDWIQSVDKEMKRKGTVGAFTKQAKDAGMSVHDFATKVMNNKKDFSKKTQERANFALNMEKIAKKRKMAHGGMTQGYNSRLDEDLGTRLGKEKKYKQSLKDRRDESKGANKAQGYRPYSSVRTMDKGDRMMMEGGRTEFEHGGYHKKMAHGGRMKMAHGGRMKMAAGGFIEDVKLTFKKNTEVQILDEDGIEIDVENYKKGEQENVDVLSSDGNFLMVQFADGYVAYINKDNVTKTKFAHGGRMKMAHGGRMKMAHGGRMKMAHGGRMKQGYDAREDESLGMRRGKQSTKKISAKGRRDDSYGKFGKRDEEDRDIKLARGGSVKGKIDRDRYVKLRREKDKEIKKLKKEKGVLRKEASKKQDCPPVKTESKKQNQEAMLLGGIAGILFGAFLGR